MFDLSSILVVVSYSLCDVFGLDPNEVDPCITVEGYAIPDPATLADPTAAAYPIPQTKKIAGKCCQPFGRTTALWGCLSPPGVPALPPPGGSKLDLRLVAPRPSS